MSLRRLTVFLSSTGGDLAPYRKAIIDHMRPLDGFLVDAMEDFGARDGAAVSVCREKVRAADVLVGLTGHYRGWEPPSDNQQRSITEMEYDWAAAAEKSRLMYVAPDVLSDLAPPQTDAERERQQSFRARVLSENVCDARFLNGQLRDPAEVAAAVVGALANLTYRAALAAIQASEQPLATPSAERPVWRRLLLRWFGSKPAGVSPLPSFDEASQVEPVSQASPTAAEPLTALAAFAHDPAYAGLLDPATFDLAKLEAAVVARGEARLGHAQAERAAAAADYKRLAGLTGYYDIAKARGYYARAVAADPTDGMALYSFCELSVNAGNTAAAEAACARFDPIAAAAADPRGAFWAQLAYGDLCASQGNLTLALVAFTGARDVAERLAKADPGHAGWQRDVSVSYNKVGDVLVAQGQLPEALKAFRDSLSIAERLAKADPGHAGWQRDVSVSYNKVGAVLVAQGDLAGALLSFTSTRDILERLAKADPGHAGWQRDVSVSYEKVGDVLVAQGQLPEALKAFRDSLSIRERLAKADPGNAGWQADLAVSHGKLGQLYVKLGDKPEALQLFKAGRAIVAPFAERSGHQLWIGYLNGFDADIAALE